jgi:hypothetical protein
MVDFSGAEARHTRPSNMPPAHAFSLTVAGIISVPTLQASWQIDPTGGTTTPTVEKAWDIGHRTMMRDTTLALGDGVLLGKYPKPKPEPGLTPEGKMFSCLSNNINIKLAEAVSMRCEENLRGRSKYTLTLNMHPATHHCVD